MRLGHTLMPCGHDNVVPRRWTECCCTTCHRVFFNYPTLPRLYKRTAASHATPITRS